MVDTPAFAAGEFGQGRVLIYSPHPESSEALHFAVTRAIDWIAGR